MSVTNREILQQLNESKLWFEAVKVAPVWAKENDGETSISSMEGVTSADVGDMICKGPKGELWAQPAEKFSAKYRPTEKTDAEGFKKYLPNPESSRVMAAKIDHPFEVVSDRGVLKGQKGDYILKSVDDRTAEFPESIWIVAEDIFATTYKPI
ncbi:MAG: PGDYG domain-containing protein [Verrucomicrobiales bacterium]|nr:PGDYG domain-containing protein [Verrucomicrobiales bacterium]